MLPKMALDDPVTVTDQRPYVDGVITECSTWGKVNGTDHANYCYRIRVETWNPPERWIDEGFLLLRKRDDLKCDYSLAFEPLRKDTET